MVQAKKLSRITKQGRTFLSASSLPASALTILFWLSSCCSKMVLCPKVKFKFNVYALREIMKPFQIFCAVPALLLVVSWALLRSILLFPAPPFPCTTYQPVRRTSIRRVSSPALYLAIENKMRTTLKLLELFTQELKRLCCRKEVSCNLSRLSPRFYRTFPRGSTLSSFQLTTCRIFGISFYITALSFLTLKKFN